MDGVLILAATIGFVQGFVGYASTIGLSGKLAVLIIGKARGTFEVPHSERRLTISESIAKAISLVFLFVLHVVVLDSILVLLSHDDLGSREQLGRIYVIALVVGVAVSRILPEVESKVGSNKN